MQIRYVNETTYINAALRTDNSYGADVLKRSNQRRFVRLLHASMGLVTEASELLQAVQDYTFYKRQLDIPNTIEELGDMCWYCAILLDELQHTFETIQTVGINKQRCFSAADRLRNLDQPHARLLPVVGDIGIDAGEMLDILKKHLFYGRDIDFMEIDKRLYGIILCIQQIAKWLEVDFAQILRTNIEKLSSRYPDKFTEVLANNRDLAKERTILERGI